MSAFDTLVAETRRLVHNANDVADQQITSIERVNRELVAKFLAVHLAGKDDPTAYDAFLRENHVRRTLRSVNELHPTVLAFFDVSVRRLYRQRITQYAQVAYILYAKQIAPKDASIWLDEKDTVAGKMISGLSKAVLLYKHLPEIWERNTVRREKARAERDDLLANARRVGKLKTDLEAYGVKTGDLVVVFGHLNADGCFEVLDAFTEAADIEKAALRMAQKKVKLKVA